MSGALLAMPMLVINMGGEMVYILEQRLRAQKIPQEKSRKVLSDVVKTMYNKKFITELFKPQALYSNRSTRQIFDRLAHSSIMRLNTNSMDKLYDLMTMGFKYQMICCNSPVQLLQVTFNHLESLKAIVDSPSVASLLDDATRLTQSTYGTLPVGEYFALKHTLCKFFQDRRVKVSLFLQDGTQNLDGTIVLNPTGPVPAGTVPPGRVMSYDDDGSSTKTDMPDLRIEGATDPAEGDPYDADSRPCKLGLNMYLRERSKKTTKTPTRFKRGAAAAVAEPSDEGSKHEEAEESKVAGSATAGLNLLASLIGADEASTEATTFTIKSLFAEDILSGEGKEAEGPAVINIDATERTTMEDMMADLAMDDGAADSKLAEEEDDLLALMDSAN